MFNKLKQFKDLREQGKKLQNALAGESASATEAGGKVSVTIDGNLNVTDIKIDPEMLHADQKEKLERALKDAQNAALKKIQRTVAMKMQQMGGFNIPGMS